MLRRLRFTFYFGITFLLWMSIQLVEDYTVNLRLPVKYVNMPAKLKLTRQLPAQLELQVRGRGQDLLLPFSGFYLDTVEIDLREAVGKGRLITSKLGDDLKSQLPASYNILSIYPDTIPIFFVKKIQKRVPVVPRISLQTDAGFFLTRSIHIEPDSVTLFGAEEDLRSISSWPTEELQLKKVHENGEAELMLATSQQVVVSHSKVKAQFQVQRFTEITREVMVEMDDKPLNVEVRLLPDRVRVHYLVPMEHYEAYQRLPVRVVVRYEDMLPGAELVRPIIQGLPDNIIGQRINPTYVRFIQRKNQ